MKNKYNDFKSERIQLVNKQLLNRKVSNMKHIYFSPYIALKNDFNPPPSQILYDVIVTLGVASLLGLPENWEKMCNI